MYLVYCQPPLQECKSMSVVVFILFRAEPQHVKKNLHRVSSQIFIE